MLSYARISSNWLLNASTKKFGLFIAIFIVGLEIFSLLILRHRDSPSVGFYQPTPLGDGISQSNSLGDILPLKPYANLNWETQEFKVLVEINSDRIRDVEGKVVGHAEYLFLGDSFTFGHGVERFERFSTVFEKTLQDGQAVVNAAYRGGFQPQHYLAFIKKLATRPRKVIIGLYLGNDFGSDLTETFVDPNNGRVHLPWRWIDQSGAMRNSPSVYHPPLNFCVNHSSFCELVVRVLQKTSLRRFIIRIPVNQPNDVDLELGRTSLESNESFKALLSLRDLVESWGGEFWVCIIPQNFYVAGNSGGFTNPHINPLLLDKLALVRGGPNLLRQTRQALSGAGIQYIDTSEVLTIDDYFKIDSHWNKYGHAKVAELIRRRFIAD